MVVSSVKKSNVWIDYIFEKEGKKIKLSGSLEIFSIHVRLTDATT
jgi:hypothetical protein